MTRCTRSRRRCSRDAYLRSEHVRIGRIESGWSYRPQSMNMRSAVPESVGDSEPEKVVDVTIKVQMRLPAEWPTPEPGAGPRGFREPLARYLSDRCYEIADNWRPRTQVWIGDYQYNLVGEVIDVEIDADNWGYDTSESTPSPTPEDWKPPMIRYTADQLAVLNRLESNLGCIQCRGPLTRGRCPDCQGLTPSAKETPDV